jgi:hypothetical protein
MDYNTGDLLYSKSSKYQGGRICDIKKGKFFLDTGNSIVEIDESELEYDFYGEILW